MNVAYPSCLATHQRQCEWVCHFGGAAAIARGMLVSVFPSVMYRSLGDAATMSKVYFAIGLASLIIGLSVPYLICFVPRRWVHIAGTLMFATGAGLVGAWVLANKLHPRLGQARIAIEGFAPDVTRATDAPLFG